MTLQQLAYFLAVARTRHFTRAAQESHVAQPSLSRQVHALERELGAPLFSRARGKVTLTPAGETLLPLAQRILADTETARTEVLELVGLRRGRLRLGATPSLCVSLVADVLRRFHDDYPGIELVVEENGSRDLERDLVGGALDVALVIVPKWGARRGGIGQSGPRRTLTELPLLREDLVVASRAGSPPPVRRARFRLTDLADQSLVMFRDGYDLRDVTLHACRQAGVRPRLSVEGGEMDAVLSFVEAGLGVAIVPTMVLAGRQGLRATPLAQPGLSRTIALAHRADVAPVHAARAFQATLLDWLADAGESLPNGVRRLRTP